MTLERANGTTRTDAPIAVEDRRRPFLWVDAAVLYRYQEMAGAPFAVYCALASFANVSRVAWPSQGTIAGMLGLDRVTVNRAIDRLVALGLVERAGRRGVAVLYRLLPVDTPKGVAPGLHVAPEQPVAPRPPGCSPQATGDVAPRLQGCSPGATQTTPRTRPKNTTTTRPTPRPG